MKPFIINKKDFKIQDLLDMGNSVFTDNQHFQNIPFWFKEHGEDHLEVYMLENLPLHIKEAIEEFLTDSIRDYSIDVNDSLEN